MIGAALLLAFAPQGARPFVDDAELLSNLRAHPAARAVMESADEHRVQVLFAAVATDEKGRARLERRGVRVDREYFYPASSIKLCAAVAALERLGELRRKEPRLTVDTPLVIHPLFAGEEREERDPTNLETGAFTLRHEIRKLFLVSDNAAFNRLYEIAGQQELADSLERAGLKSARVVHRLSEVRSEDENRRVPRIDFVIDGSVAATLPERTSRLKIADLRSPGIKIGRARVEGSRTVEGPMSFARKNSISLVDLQSALARLVRPDLQQGGEPYALDDEQRDLLLDAASQYPSESRNPRYPRDQFPDSFVKFLLPGLERAAPKEQWRIANKVGRAYGFSVENAWVVHLPSGRGLFVAAVVYTNRNGVLNDGVYEYEEVADPFLAAVGEIAGRELAR